MINDEFEGFWEWLLNEALISDYPKVDEWLKDKLLKYLAEKRPGGWDRYIDDIYEYGYITKEVYKEELMKI